MYTFVSILEAAFSVMVKWHYNVVIGIPKARIYRRNISKQKSIGNGVVLMRRKTMSFFCDMGYSHRREIHHSFWGTRGWYK